MQQQMAEEAVRKYEVGKKTSGADRDMEHPQHANYRERSAETSDPLGSAEETPARPFQPIPEIKQVDASTARRLFEKVHLSC